MRTRARHGAWVMTSTLNPHYATYKGVVAAVDHQAGTITLLDALVKLPQQGASVDGMPERWAWLGGPLTLPYTERATYVLHRTGKP